MLPGMFRRCVLKGGENMPLEIRYFVLNPKGTDSYANASREALVAYAESIKNHDPALAKDIWEWVDDALTKSLEEKK